MHRIWATLITVVVVAWARRGQASSSPQQLTVDPGSDGLRFDGVGALSAGASSRLLFDYEPTVRSEILDYLYKPKFGASLEICKVEIGGDTQSSEGTEPSHMHTRDDLNCTRGYEFWLMTEAKKRNPSVLTYGLAWGAPGWINNQSGYYGPDLITYEITWLKCARDHHNISVDYLGTRTDCQPHRQLLQFNRSHHQWLVIMSSIDYVAMRTMVRAGLWNEMPWGNVQFVKDLKQALRAEGLATQLILGDGQKGQIPPVLNYKNDSEFMAAFSGVGLHYPCDAQSERGTGQVCTPPFWSRFNAKTDQFTNTGSGQS
jgi:hypothetical protein